MSDDSGYLPRPPTITLEEALDEARESRLTMDRADSELKKLNTPTRFRPHPSRPFSTDDVDRVAHEAHERVVRLLAAKYGFPAQAIDDLIEFLRGNYMHPAERFIHWMIQDYCPSSRITIYLTEEERRDLNFADYIDGLVAQGRYPTPRQACTNLPRKEASKFGLAYYDQQGKSVRSFTNKGIIKAYERGAQVRSSIEKAISQPAEE